MASTDSNSLSHRGEDFTRTLHDRAEGRTEPRNNKRSSSQPFNVVITGAGKGIGRAIAVSYAEAGATGICISSRTQSDLDSLADELKQINPSVNIVVQICDTTSPDSVSALASACKTAFAEQVDVVIANAGIISKYLNDYDVPEGADVKRRLPVGIIEDDDFTRVTQINYLGSYYTAKYFTPLLLSAPNADSARAYIVITSLASQMAESSFVPIAYNVSKLAVNRMVEHMAADHGDEKEGGTGKGLLAFAVHPGEVVTPQTLRHSTQKGDSWEQLLQTSPDLVGGFLTWLTKERRDWLSGRYLSVHWDVDELEAKKSQIVQKDLLKFRMVVE